MEERQNASDWREVEEWLNDMKQNSEEEYRKYMDYLRISCYTFGPSAYGSLKKLRQMRRDGYSEEEVLEWFRGEQERLEPIQRDNEIALSGTDEEVIELAKRICPECLKAKKIIYKIPWIT